MMCRMVAGGLVACVLSMAAGAAQAAVQVIDFENLALGPISGLVEGHLSIGPRAAIVDIGGGDQALQLSSNPAAIQAVIYEQLRFLGYIRTGPNTEDVYRLTSLDFMASSQAFYGTDYPQYGGIAPAGQWITWSLSNNPAGGVDRINFSAVPSVPFTVLIDNVKYEYLGVRTVPEPSTWSMLIGGFGLIGLRLRKRRQRASARPATA